MELSITPPVQAPAENRQQVERSATAPTGTPHCGGKPLMWIATYNFAKGLLFLVIALGLLGFLHKDVDVIVARWMGSWGVNLENQHVEAFLARLDLVTDKQLELLSAVTCGLGAVFVVEGIGLYFKQRWAEFLTIIVTASFIPVEVIESIKHFGPIKFVLLIVNIVIVWALVAILRADCKAKHARG